MRTLQVKHKQWINVYSSNWYHGAMAGRGQGHDLLCTISVVLNNLSRDMPSHFLILISAILWQLMLFCIIIVGLPLSLSALVEMIS